MGFPIKYAAYETFRKESDKKKMGGKLSTLQQQQHANVVNSNAIQNTFISSSPSNNHSNNLANDDVEEKRFVLLGNTSSGKTTICEMIRYENRKKEHFTSIDKTSDSFYHVDTNTISRIIIQQILYSSSSSSSDRTVEFIINEKVPNGNFDDHALVALWNDDRFRKIYRTNQDTLNLFENVDIFVSKIKNRERFIPDIYIKGGSSGIIDYSVIFNKNRLTFVTAGGKIHERRKWRYCLENQVSVLIYVVSLSEFNQTCYGDEKVNRMDESLKLYKELIGNHSNTRIILLFTKPDLMMKKLRNYIKFERPFETQLMPELEQIVNDYHERDVVNTIISNYLRTGNGNVSEYHIIKSISDFDISQVVKYVVNSNEKNNHYISNCLFEKTTLKRCYQSMIAQKLTDLMINCQF